MLLTKNTVISAVKSPFQTLQITIFDNRLKDYTADESKLSKRLYYRLRNFADGSLVEQKVILSNDFWLFVRVVQQRCRIELCVCVALPHNYSEVQKNSFESRISSFFRC